jgi:pilus assembly protein CpaC
MAKRTDTTLGWIRPQRGLAGAGYCALTVLLAAAGGMLAVDALAGANRGDRTGARVVKDTDAARVAPPDKSVGLAAGEKPGGVGEVDRAAARTRNVPGAAVLAGVRAELEDVGSQRAVLITDGLQEGRVALSINKSTVLATRVAYKRVSVGSADVAEVNTIGPSSLLVTAKKPGTTQLIVWDDDDRSQVVDVVVNADLDGLRAQLKEMFPGSKIEATTAGGQVVLRGQVSSTQVAEQAEQLAAPFAPKVLNFLEVAGGQQVDLQVRFAEVSKSATNQLGFNFGYNDGRSFMGNNIGQVSPLGFKDNPAGQAVPSIMSPSASVTLFGLAGVGDTTVAYYIAALRQNNLLRVLAEPNMVVISGQEANFVAGGEFPSPVSQGGSSSGGGAAITVEYRTYGVKLRFTPVVLGDGKIRLKVAPEVSDLDFTTAVKFNGFVIPGLTQRKLETVVEMREGQTLALAGLLNNNVTANKDVTPLLGDLPYIGALFRSVRYQRKETELVVIVTPRLVEAMNPAQVPQLPGERWRHPTEGDLFWKRDIGGPGADAKRAAGAGKAGEAPRFKGEYGFVPADE